MGNDTVHNGFLHNYGSIKIDNAGSSLCFPDGTCMTSAITQDVSAVWGQITGIIANQTDLQAAMALKEDKSNKAVIDGYMPYKMLFAKNVQVSGSTPVFVSNSSWVEITEFSMLFSKQFNNSYLDVTYSDNIGVQGASWCNVGLFIDNSSYPFCYGSFSGDGYSTTFRQETLHCVNTSTLVGLPNTWQQITAGNHSIHVKHRSGSCAYGNYPNTGDEYGTMRRITVREM